MLSWLRLGSVSLRATVLLQGVPQNFVNEILLPGLSEPTSLAFAPDGRTFITERLGRV